MIRAMVRNDFPILRRRIHGKPFAYLDSTATTQKPEAVIQAMDEFQRKFNANVHRGIYTVSEEATALYEGARKKLADFIDAWSEREIVFTRNATEAINLVAYAWGRANVKQGDNVAVSLMEHHSNIVPWQLLTKEVGADLRVAPVNVVGEIDMKKLTDLITRRTKLVAITGMSNVLGTMPDIPRIARMAHRKGALVLVDGAQSVAHMPTDVRKLGADFLAISGHKMLGPSGIGALWARQELLEQMPPFLGGGDMIREVTLEKATWNDVPWKFEAGTPNAVGAVGLGAAVDYLQKLGMGNVHQHEQTLVAYALKKLRAIKGVTIYGPLDARKKGGVIAFNVEGVHSHDLATLLDREGAAIRSGHHCAQPLMRKFGVMATARMSFSVYTTKRDIDQAIAAIEKARKTFDS
ncbi:MAG: cysteine desulfurase [Candidatus Kerfeldbacteria bacterium]|nr:cysteine desulfurase [Candidatus Kerfeldbacteria bacterium]